jgi:hypothetical protein
MTGMGIAGLLGLALVVALLAGAASGVKIGAQHLGTELAALMGALFGPTAVLPAVALGLGILYFWR